MDNITMSIFNDLNADAERRLSTYQNMRIMGLSRMSSPFDVAVSLSRQTSSAIKEVGDTLFDALTHNL